MSMRRATVETIRDGQGWSWPPNSRTAHYYLKDHRTVCGRGRVLPEDLDGFDSGPSSSDCAGCRRKVVDAHAALAPGLTACSRRPRTPICGGPALPATGRFCGRCDREEYDAGRVQPGWRTDPTSAEGARWRPRNRPLRLRLPRCGARCWFAYYGIVGSSAPTCRRCGRDNPHYRLTDDPFRSGGTNQESAP